MSASGTMAQEQNQRPPQQNQTPPLSSNNSENEDGVSIRPMRLKVLYTFDDQNKTNCLARGEDVLNIRTVAMDETTSIGILDLKTCIETVTRCSPELLSRVGQDYTVYAYDYSEYDNPLVGQGMLSRVLSSSSPSITPAQQSQKLITGRVCKNILGLFNNGVKETLEVKLRLVPVPTAIQSEYVNTMERYRDMSGNVPAGFDHNEWTKFLQSNPNMAQMAGNFGAPASTTSSHRGSMNMEVVNQLLSPTLSQTQNSQDPFNQASNTDSGNETRGGAASSKGKKTSRPSSRASLKRPRAKRQLKPATTGGNTSGYEEGTDGDDGPAPRKRAKTTQTDWKSKSSFGASTESLRVTASTSGSLRMFRPLAISPAPTAGSHLQELPRAPTPVPNLPDPKDRDREPIQSGLRRSSYASQFEAPRKHVSPYPILIPIEDQIRDSIESANPSPERRFSPADTPPEIRSSPPVMRTASIIRSSPPCPSSPVLPEMPPTDSGFMSGTLDELFGEDDDEELDDDYVERAPYLDRRRVAQEEKKRIQSQPAQPQNTMEGGFIIEEEVPGPMELLPTTMPIFTAGQSRPASKAASKASRSRAASVMSEDGQSLPTMKSQRHASSRQPTPMRNEAEDPPAQSNLSQVTLFDQPEAPRIASQPATERNRIQGSNTPQPEPPAQPRQGSRMLVRTASMGSLSLPAIPASDPVLPPPSSLQRSQTWAEACHPTTENPMATQTQGSNSYAENGSIAPFNRPPVNTKKASMRQRLETALAEGKMPPYCGNCGTIETPTWRKAWSQEHSGTPPYHEYSDAPGRVTATIILNRDSEGNPTLYQLLKKRLGETDSANDWREFMLCNPCGLWLTKHLRLRPEAQWECNAGNKDNKRSNSRPAAARKRSKKTQPPGEVGLTSDAYFPMSDMYYPQSEAYYPPPETYRPVEGGVSPTDTSQLLDLQIQRVEIPANPPQINRSGNRNGKRHLNAMTSDAASAALRRAIQSSPARWAENQDSPVEVEDVGSTRRLLFPSPRKDGSPKVLGETEANVIQIEADVQSTKEKNTETVNKENCPPAFDANAADAELIAMFEEEMARPTTPVRTEAPPNPFKTPTRPTPSHRPVTRSVSKSIRSAKSPGQLLMFAHPSPSKTPSSSARRRSPRNHRSVFESPFTASLNQMMSEANNQSSPSRHFNMELDFGNLPDLGMMDTTMQHNNGDLNFNLNDYFSNELPMPSSPPRMFHLYEDPVAMDNIDWNEFSQFDDALLNNSTRQNTVGIAIKEEPQEEVGVFPKEPENATAPAMIHSEQSGAAKLVVSQPQAPELSPEAMDVSKELAPSQMEGIEKTSEVASKNPPAKAVEESVEDSPEDDDEVDMLEMND